MRVLFLFGAGASYGSDTTDTPPLGTGEDGLFAKLIDMGGEASKLPQELRDHFIKDFERAMSRVRPAESGLNLTTFQREIGAFLSAFRPSVENKYIELVVRMSDLGMRPVMATTNYDLLIELAVRKVGYGVCYCTRDINSTVWGEALMLGLGGPSTDNNYSVRSRYYRGESTGNDFLLLKVHGSSNFLPFDHNLSWHINNLSFPPGAPLYDGIIYAADADEAKGYCETEGKLGPAISLYEPGKELPVGRSYIRAIQDEFRSNVLAADVIAIVGLSVNLADKHIWGTISESSARIMYVDCSTEPFRKWAEGVGKGDAIIIENYFGSAIESIITKLAELREKLPETESAEEWTGGPITIGEKAYLFQPHDIGIRKLAPVETDLVAQEWAPDHFDFNLVLSEADLESLTKPI